MAIMLHNNMSIYKVAKKFHQKLVFASLSNFQGLKNVYDSVMDLTSPNIKNLWLSAEKDVESPYDDNIGDILDTLRSTANKFYNQAMTYGLPASGPSGYSAFLTNAEKSLQELSAWIPSKPLDPMASDKMSMFKNALQNAQHSYQTVGIPAQQSKQETIVVPEQRITPDSLDTPEGASNTGEPSGASPDALSDVVNNLVSNKWDQ